MCSKILKRYLHKQVLMYLFFSFLGENLYTFIGCVQTYFSSISFLLLLASVFMYIVSNILLLDFELVQIPVKNYLVSNAIVSLGSILKNFFCLGIAVVFFSVMPDVRMYTRTLPRGYGRLNNKEFYSRDNGSPNRTRGPRKTKIYAVQKFSGA